MATLPLVFECNFEDNTSSPFDSETDTDSKLNIRHFSWLAKQGFPDYIPYFGAYAAEIQLALGTNDAYYQENTGFDTGLAGTVALQMYFYASGLTMAVSDRFTIATLQSAGNTDEATISVINNAGTIQLVAAETGATALGAATRATDLIQGQYHCLELVCVIDSGGGNDGTIAFYVDGYQIGSTITGLDQGAIIQGRFGAIGIDAGTTAGRLLIDSVAGDTVQIGQRAKRFGYMRTITKSSHVALGPGAIIEADIQLSTAADETMVLYDTDKADTTDVSMRVPVFQAMRPVYFRLGLYAVLGGTNPVGSVKIYESQDMSIGGIRDIGVARV